MSSVSDSVLRLNEDLSFSENLPSMCTAPATIFLPYFFSTTTLVPDRADDGAMNDDQYIIKDLEAHHIQYAVSMAEDAGMKPNLFQELDFFRKNDTSEFVGLFFSTTTTQSKDEVPLGVAGLLHDEERDYLVLLIVNKEHRRKGIGQKLVQWAINRGRKQGSTKVLQLVASKMGSPLYKSLGFIESGYTNLYQIRIGSGSSSKMVANSDDMSKREIMSFKMKDLTNTTGKEQHLWQQATVMLSEATSSDNRTTRLISLLQRSSIHLLYDITDSAEPKLIAWTAIRRFSQKSNVIGPLIGYSIEHVIYLVRSITSKMESGSELESDSLVIHTDGQSGQEPQLAKALEEGGWEKVIKLEKLELQLKRGQEFIPTKESSAKQFALTDFSHQ